MSAEYSLTISQQMMTLSAIAYTLDRDKKSDKPYPISKIKEAIICQLHRTEYATRGEWELVWGPVMDDNPARGPDTDNLWFIVKHKNEKKYAVVLRGTSPQWRSWWQDIPTKQVPDCVKTNRRRNLRELRFKSLRLAGNLPALKGHLTTWRKNILCCLRVLEFSHSLVRFALGDILESDHRKVSNKFEKDALTITKMTNGDHTIANYLQEQSKHIDDMTVYVTGHSQGGGLAPMVQGHILAQSKHWENSGARVIQGYTFAGPTSGNPAFAKYVDESLTLFRVVNPYDIVPFGYASLRDIIRQSVPAKVPLWARTIICSARWYLKWIGRWQQPMANAKPLKKEREPKKASWFGQVEYQHGHNTYLSLLGAPQVKLPT